MQYYNINSEILNILQREYPGKFGLYTPGTSIKIISKSKARKLNPEEFIYITLVFLRSFINREYELLNTNRRKIYGVPYGCGKLTNNYKQKKKFNLN